LPDFFTWNSTTGLRPYAILTALCALLFLPGLASISPIDRDESRFMQATKQMLETGDLVHISVQDEPRNKKPIGIYWLQVLAVKISGIQDLATAWPYRLPSVVGAWLAVLALFRYGKGLFDAKTGLMAAVMLATCLIVVVEAHIAKTDAVLLATVTIAMLVLARFYTSPDDRAPSLGAALFFWVTLGIGFLVKGPLILLVIGVTIFALCTADRSARWLKALHPEFGVPVALAVVLPWVLVASTGNGGNFFADAVSQDLVPKLVGGQESHGAFPGVHLLALFATAWPWSVLVPFAGILGWRQRTKPAVRFCLAWLLPAWLIFELVPTKLPHYTMPLLPALMLLTAAGFNDQPTRRDLMSRSAGLTYRTIWAVISIALGGAVVWAAYAYGESLAMAVLAAFIASGAGAFGLIAITRFTAGQTVSCLASLCVLFVILLTLGVVPNLDRLAVSQRLADAAAPHRDQDTIMAVAGFHEPSAVFLLGTDTWLTSWDGATGLLLSSQVGLIAVPAEDIPRVEAELIRGNMRMNTLAEVEGRNYSRGEDVRLVLVSASPASVTGNRLP
jgi:4-amino-4-deoxy-L-arabinose transferase-like glycosyltransferase